MNTLIDIVSLLQGYYEINKFKQDKGPAKNAPNETVLQFGQPYEKE